MGTGAQHAGSGDPVVGDPVVDLRWPAQAAERLARQRSGLPRLLVVDRGAEPPPTWDPLEDWVRPGADAVERHVRRERLRRRFAARPPPVLDEDGLLRRGSSWVALPPGERATLARLLAVPGSTVTRAALAEAVGRRAGDGPRALDNVIRRLRRRIAPLGMTVCAVRGTGFLLDVGELPGGAAPARGR